MVHAHTLGRRSHVPARYDVKANGMLDGVIVCNVGVAIVVSTGKAAVGVCNKGLKKEVRGHWHIRIRVAPPMPTIPDRVVNAFTEDIITHIVHDVTTVSIDKWQRVKLCIGNSMHSIDRIKVILKVCTCSTSQIIHSTIGVVNHVLIFRVSITKVVDDLVALLY